MRHSQPASSCERRQRAGTVLDSDTAALPLAMEARAAAADWRYVGRARVCGYVRVGATLRARP